MKKFKDSFDILIEKRLKLPSGEKAVKTMPKLGKRKDIEAVITKKGNKFNIWVDGQMLDTFKNERDAEKGVAEFIKVMRL